MDRAANLRLRAGLTPLQAIQAATIRAAEYLGWDADAGSLAVGKRGDLVILRDDPLEDIRASRRIDAVYVSGRRIDPNKLLPSHIGR